MSGKKKKNRSLLSKAQAEGKLKVTPSGGVSVAGETIKILAWGASPYVITGFGLVMRKILSNLFRSHPGKYDVSLVGINHSGDHQEELEITGDFRNGRFRIWPAVPPGAPPHFLYGQQKFLSMLAGTDQDYDLIFLFEDPFWVGGPVPGSNPQTIFIDEIKKILAMKGQPHIPVVCYFPIDGVPKTPWIQNIAKCDVPITYLKFGAEACVRAVPSLSNRLCTIPHGVDPKEFFPIPGQEARAFRRAMFGDEFADKFMFLNVNRNQLRKLVPSTLLAFREFQRQTKGAGFLYLNMKAVDVGWNLLECCNALGLNIGSDVLFPPNFSEKKGLSLQDLNRVFNTADVLISTAVGGGWELSVTQAFATKTAVLVPNNTSHVELCGPQTQTEMRGMLFSSGKNLAQTIIFPSDNEVPRPLPDIEDMVSKMLFLYQNREFKSQMEERAYSWALKELSWDTYIVPEFDKIFSLSKKLKMARMGASSGSKPNVQISNTVTQNPQEEVIVGTEPSTEDGDVILPPGSSI